jgi:signal transduction histidine kinase
VPLGRRSPAPARRLRFPRRTIRLRLALLYGGGFFISGAVLLALTYAGVAHIHGAYSQAVGASPIHPGSGAVPAPGQLAIPFPRGTHAHVTVSVVDPNQRNVDLRVLAVVSAIALALMAAISMGLGWLLAGRVLRPLRTITTAARDISATDLHRRLALDGPDDEFKELGDTFDGLLARLDASFQSQRQFVANASHELRTPLARLKTLAQVALADPRADVASLRAAHERVLASEQQLEGLIEALLSLAVSERGLDRREPVDLTAIARDALVGRHAEIERRGLQLHVEFEPARVEGDPQLLERLVANLVDNAIGHNTTGGRVELTTATGSGGAVLAVANDGPVISPQELERLRRPFQRLGAERTDRGDGHGLGLSIVHAIADAHGASLAIDPRPAGGLHAEVRFRDTGPPHGGPTGPSDRGVGCGLADTHVEAPEAE